jgi:putative transcriptional regulator
VEEAAARVTPVPAGIQAGLSMTREEFAALPGRSVRTVQNWEAGRRKPDGAAKSLLRVAAIRPDIVLAAARRESAARPTASVFPASGKE